jgi:hypothetical protein
MSINKNFEGALINEPGSYSSSKTDTSGSGNLATRGVVALIGESSAGEPGSSAGAVEFLPTEIKTLIDTYKTGPLVDASLLAFNPANDDK